jgi:hypothetical protein
MERRDTGTFSPLAATGGNASPGWNRSITRRVKGAMTNRFAVSAAIGTLLLAACTTGPGGRDGIPHPDGSEVVVQVEHAGGFVPPEFLFGSLPHFTLLGDGRVIVTGPQLAIFPGPALPNLQVRRLTEGGIQTVLQLLAESEVLSASAEYRGAANFVADAGDTIFRVNADGAKVEVIVHALGTFDPQMGPQQGVSPEELAAHAALSVVNESLAQLDAWLEPDAWADPTWTDYEAEALRLLVRPVGPDEDPGVPPGELAWPLDRSPVEMGPETPFGRCGVVTDDEAAVMLEALREATQITHWMHQTTAYSVTPRPLLPGDEPACPEGF